MKNEDARLDFQIEAFNKPEGQGPSFYTYTPLSYAAVDWCRRNLSKQPTWGRSYLLDTKRGKSLRGYLNHKEGFVVG